MQNQEYFRLYALWTFGLSSLYCLAYLVIVLDRHRTMFAIIMGLIMIGLIAYWFRDGGVKQGWDRLDDGLIVVIILALVSCVLMIIATFYGVAALSTLPLKSDRSAGNMLAYLLRISPVALTGINTINLLIFLAKE